MKKSLATLTFTALALSTIAISGLVSRYTASAESKLNSSRMAPAASAVAQEVVSAELTTGIVMPKVPIFALNANNAIFVLQPGATSFTRLGRINTANGNLIGIDFRPSNKLLYALTDTGTVYTVALGANTLGATTLGAATKVSTLSPRCDGGYQ